MRRQSRNAEATGWHGQGGVYYATHEPGAPGGLLATLTHAIAEATGVDVTVAEQAVGDRVDPAALDRLFAPHGTGRAVPALTLGFDLWGYAVTVRADGAIQIRPPSTGGPPQGRPGYGGPRSPYRT